MKETLENLRLRDYQQDQPQGHYPIVAIRSLEGFHAGEYRIVLQIIIKGCLVQVGNGIGLEAVGLQFDPYWWLPLTLAEVHFCYWKLGGKQIN